MVDLVPTFTPAAPDSVRRGVRPTEIPLLLKNRDPTATTGSGSGTILSFFSRQSASATSVNPVKVIKANAQVSIVEPKKENVPLRCISTEPKRVSRFFVGSARKGKACPPEDGAAAKPPIDTDVVGVVDLCRTGGPDDEAGGSDNGDDDLEAEAALREIELCVEIRPQTVRSPITPPPDTTAGRELGAVSVDAEKEPLRHSALGVATSPQKIDPDAADPSLETPPPTRSQRRDHLDDVSEDGGISSPAYSTSAQAGWPVIPHKSPEILSSPVPTSAHLLAAPLAPKREVGLEAKRALSPTLQLSSDPIIISSEADVDNKNTTPRPPKRSPRPPKGRKPSPLSSRGRAKAAPVRESRAPSLAVWEDTPRAETRASADSLSIGRSKAKNTRVKEEEAAEGASDAVEAVAASWRAKFMLPTASKVRPTLLATGTAAETPSYRADAPTRC